MVPRNSLQAQAYVPGMGDDRYVHMRHFHLHNHVKFIAHSHVLSLYNCISLTPCI